MKQSSTDPQSINPGSHGPVARSHLESGIRPSGKHKEIAGTWTGAREDRVPGKGRPGHEAGVRAGGALSISVPFGGDAAAPAGSQARLLFFAVVGA